MHDSPTYHGNLKKRFYLKNTTKNTIKTLNISTLLNTNIGNLNDSRLILQDGRLSMCKTICVYNWTQTHNGWVFVYKLRGCGFESSCSHLNFRNGACFEQGVPWHSGKYRVSIHSEMHTWHDRNIQSYDDIFINTWLFFFFKNVSTWFKTFPLRIQWKNIKGIKKYK